MSAVGSRFSFNQLLNHHGSIRIPMIQRDYAQGRESALQVREDFLAAVESALRLPSGSPELPMNLDFIYGSVSEVEGESRFEPLDGQQRLTTLFLLYWYLAWKDDCFDQFVRLIRRGDHSRFAYAVRQSSNEFFDAIVNWHPASEPSTIQMLSGLIANQPWYFRSWRLDPTIKSVLSMLDAIHERFKGTVGLFSRLIDQKQPAITFQLLDLENFGLSDDLYIKMNARGKPLTPFETFKARYEQVLSSQFEGETRSIGPNAFPIHEFVARRMDTTWLDLFWSSNKYVASIADESMFNLLRLLALVTRNPGDESCLSDVTLLSNTRPHYSVFHDRGWLDKEFSQTLIAVLEQWTRNPGEFCPVLPSTSYFSEGAVFKKASLNPTSVDVLDILLFMAYCLFIQKYEATFDANAANEWMRVIHNLMVNSNIERTDRVPVGMSVIKALVPKADRILEYLQGWNVPSDFPINVKQQADEEILKAQLLVADDRWRPLIIRAEQHGYFRGQIEFLLDFAGIVEAARETEVSSWSVDQHTRLIDSFENELKKAEAMFDAKGFPSLPNFLWERALLSIGNYLLEAGSLNSSLLVNSNTEQGSWKRLLRGFSSPEKKSRSHLRTLWEKLDSNRPYEDQLEAIISSSSEQLDPWRAAIISCPQVFLYGNKRYLRFSEAGHIYLLKKKQMNGAHVELYGYSFFCTELPRLVANGELIPFEVGQYEAVNTTDREPYFELHYREGKKAVTLEIDFVSGQFRLAVNSSTLEHAPVLKTCLEQLGPITTSGLFSCVNIARDSMASTLCAVASELRREPQLGPE
jgi:hypothetical protein